MGIGRYPRRASVRFGVILAGILITLALPSAASAATASFSSQSPRPGSTVTDARPAISVAIVDRYGISGAANSSLTLDGRAVAASRRSAGVTRLTLSFRPGTALVAGTHTVTARVRDRKRRTSATSWSFTIAAAPAPPVQTPTDMPVSIEASACGTCHVGYPAQHPMTQCQLCHGPDRPVAGVVFTPASTSAHTLACATMGCHNGPPGTPFPHSMWTDCTRCHAGQFSGIGTGHGALSAASHESTNTFCTRSGCHDASLTVEHYRHTVAGARLTCGSCHASTDPNVRAALEARSTDCLSCHPTATTSHPGLPAAHASVASSCTAPGCHVADLPTVHKGSCAPCHAPGVTPSARCADCHADASHAALHAIARTDTCTGAQCHDGASLTAIQEGTATVSPHAVCATCHQSSDPAVQAAISSGDKRCAACHGTFTDHTAQHAVDRTLDTCSGTNCHSATLTSLTTIHSTCATCHASADPAVVAAIASKKTACSACHAFSGHTAVHASSLDPTCIAPGCHASTAVDLTVQHATCATCHESPDPAVHAAVAAHDSRCVACHPDAGHIGIHAVTLPADCNGDNCHVAPAGNLTFEHMSCQTCHAPTSTKITAATIAAAISAKNTNCTACHP